jgi:hypothetical protein
VLLTINITASIITSLEPILIGNQRATPQVYFGALLLPALLPALSVSKLNTHTEGIALYAPHTGVPRILRSYSYFSKLFRVFL